MYKGPQEHLICENTELLVKHNKNINKYPY